MTYGRVHIDFETCSTADLRKTGAWAYAQDPSTKVTVLAYAFDDERVQTWWRGQPFPLDLWTRIDNGGEVHAWNANFELAVWNHAFAREATVPLLTAGQTFCTMAAAAYWGLPLSLDMAAGQALKLAHQKDKAGHALMLRMARPRSYTSDGEPRWWHDEDPQKYDELQAYCRQDVRAEREVYRAIPRLPDDERAVWLLDHRMNRRGIGISMSLIRELQDITDVETKRLDDDIRHMTGGAVSSTRAVGPLVKWLQSEGVKTSSVDKANMARMLDDTGIYGLAREVLLVRQEAAKTSTAKLKSMFDAAGDDCRIRGLMQYYGAFRTGRWAGRLCQVQNYPRIPKWMKPEWAITDIEAVEPLDALRLKFGSLLTMVSALLRGCFVPEPGNRLVSVDFAQIEARVVAWLAGQWDILEVFKRGDDVYTYAAAQIGSDDRQLGKVMTLALGFGMGAEKFVATAKTYGIVLDIDRAQEIVWAWRNANSRIRSFWYEMDQLVHDVIEAQFTHSFTYHAGTDKVGVRMGRGKMAGHLLLKLPSGRYLVYRDARIEDGSIVYSGLNQYNRQWTDIRTYGGKLVENVVQAVARDLIAQAMLDIDAMGLSIIASIHDEAVMEVPEDKAAEALASVKAIMKNPPAWAKGLPVGGDGYIGVRYGKS